MTPRLRIAGLRSGIAGPFDLEIARGECVAITGPSGSGKSLFLRMVADLDPNDGEVWLDGQPRGGFTPPAWRRQVVYNAAEPGWWAEHPLEHFPPASRPRARSLAEQFGLAGERLDDVVGRLSTGERQRLALIRVLLLDPPALLLDEPTGALDSAATRSVEAALRERLAAGSAVVLVTHSAEQAGRLGDRQLGIAQRQFVLR